MNIAIICNLDLDKKPEALLVVDSDQIGYVCKNNDLEIIIESILDKENLAISMEEFIDENLIVYDKMVKFSDPNYLTAFNHHLPFPWKILGVKGSDNDFDKALEECNEYMEG